jgi:hypothetical protein
MRNPESVISSKDPIGSSPLAHARYLHDSGNQYVTIGRKIDRDPWWIEAPYKVEQLYRTLPNYVGLNDVYLSLNRFYGSRKRLARLSAMYSDLDYYNISELEHMPPEGVFSLALEALEQAKIPYPSLAMSTGRGLALVWRHKPVPGSARARWELCQEHIFEALEELGADSKAKDAARVFRVAGTYNSKSETLVQTVFENLEDVWEFGDLADEILPFTAEEWKQHKAQLLAKKTEQESARGIRMASEAQRDGRKGFDSRTLHTRRLADLWRLLELRGMDKLPSGKRNSWMLVAGCSMSFLMDPQSLERELLVLGRKLADWSEAETRSRMYSVIANARSAAAGETVQWKGQQRDTRYRLTNREIIQRLEITPEEEQHFETIVSEDRSKEIRRQRDRKRKENKRRSVGVRPRPEYLAERGEIRQGNRHRARKLKAQGMGLRKIAEELGISHTQVGSLLREKES